MLQMANWDHKEGCCDMRRFGRAALGLLVAIGMLAAVPAAVFAAQPACGDTLTSNTTLNADLDCSGYAGTALTLGKNGITLNLGGHTLTGVAGDDSYVAVYTEYKNTTITNGTINDAGYGVEVAGTTGTTVSWLTINGDAAASTDYGVYVEYGANNKFAHLTTNGQYYGMELYQSASNAIKNNTFTADEYGVYSEYETRDSFSNNTAHAPYGFYDDYGGGNSYSGNTASGGSETGFYMDCDEYGHVTMTGNTANNNGGDGFYTSYCYVDPPGAQHYSLIKGNTANGNGDSGFEDYYSVGATFTGNTANDNGDDGFYLDYPGDLHVTNNTAKHNSDSGIEMLDNYGVGYGSPASISGNVVKANDYGIYASEGVPNGVCHGNVVKNNTTSNIHGLVCS